MLTRRITRAGQVGGSALIDSKLHSQNVINRSSLSLLPNDALVTTAEYSLLEEEQKVAAPSGPSLLNQEIQSCLAVKSDIQLFQNHSAAASSEDKTVQSSPHTRKNGHRRRTKVVKKKTTEGHSSRKRE